MLSDGPPSPLRLFLAVAVLTLGCGAVANDIAYSGDENAEPPEVATVEAEDEVLDPDPLTLYRTRSRLSVYFPRGSAEITESAMSTIAENAQRLAAQARQSLLLVGFTDDFSGSAEASELAERRAAAVKGRLVDLGVAAERIEISVNREDPQVVPCMTELCRLSYRRVRFLFVDAGRATSKADAGTGGTNVK